MQVCQVTPLAIALLLASCGAALVDWWAVLRSNKSVEYVAKPGVLILLIGVALTLDPTYSSMRYWFVAALVLSLIGDIFLMLPSDRFVPGLSAFLLAHVAYSVGFLIHSPGSPAPIITTLLVVIFSANSWRRLAAGMKSGGQSAYLPPVTAYVVVIGVMGAAALASGNLVAVAGALLFVLSDSIIGETRFVGERSWGPMAVITTYHLGQALLVLSLVR